MDVATFRPVLTPDVQHPNETNTSWKVGANYKILSSGLVYANISRGYKTNIFRPFGAHLPFGGIRRCRSGSTPLKLASKIPLFDRRVQFDGAGFYDFYSNGMLEKLINVPTSRGWGLEGEIAAEPMTGLCISASGTYTEAKIASNDPKMQFYNQQGYQGTFKGSDLPDTPKFTSVVDAQYY